jgi:hypothetical protein
LSIQTALAKIFLGLIFAPRQPREQAFFEFQAILDPRKSNYKRVASLVNLGDRLIPGIANTLSLWFSQRNRFPWSSVDLDLIGFGAGAVVYKLDYGSGSKALRIYRNSIGGGVRDSLETVNFYKDCYETVLSWYEGAWDLVLPMQFLILHGPPLAGPVAASLQTYVDGHKKDFFDDFSDDELLTLMAKDVQLRDQFDFFATQTVLLCDKRGLCFDFFGRENLLLSNRQGINRLYIVDTGIFDFKKTKQKSTKNISQIEKRIHRLKSLHTRVKNI